MKLTFAVLVVGQLAGCAAATSAVSAIGGVLGSKPTQVTVINNVPAPAAEHRDPARAVAAGGLGGALAGGVIAAALHGSNAEIASGAVLGAGLGAVVGYAVN